MVTNHRTFRTFKECRNFIKSKKIMAVSCKFIPFLLICWQERFIEKRFWEDKFWQNWWLPHFIYKRSAGSISAASFSIWMSLKQGSIQFVIMLMLCYQIIFCLAANVWMGRDFHSQYKVSRESPSIASLFWWILPTKENNDTVMQMHKAFLIHTCMRRS